MHGKQENSRKEIPLRSTHHSSFNPRKPWIL